MNLREYYETQGYVVVKNLIPSELIDRLLGLYKQDIVQSKYPFFRQNTNAYEPNEVSEFGYVKQSFLDIHDYYKFPEFSTAAKEIFFSKEIHKTLQQLIDSKSFNLMQTMLFDVNTETPAHQDWWYLDTVPNGHLVAAWIALEDIDERAGRFYVLPESMKVDLHSDVPNLSHSHWRNRIKMYVDSHRDEIKAPELNKGDVLFWNSRTVHGSLQTVDGSFSRKSLTAHYLPSDYKFGNLFTTKDHIKYRTYKDMKYYRNQPDYSLINRLKFSINNSVYDSPIILRIMRKFQTLLR